MSVINELLDTFHINPDHNSKKADATVISSLEIGKHLHLGFLVAQGVPCPLLAYHVVLAS